MGEEEFMRLIELYRLSVYRLAYCCTKNHADAEDITQDVFLRLYTRAVGFPSDEDAKAWLLRVTMNRASDLLRTHWYRFSVPLEEAGIHDMPAADDSGNSILDALMKLRPNIRKVVYMHYCEGYPVKDIARMVKCSETAVTSRLWRGRKQLRDLLGDTEGGNYND